MSDHTPPIDSGLRGEDRDEAFLREFMHAIAIGNKPGNYVVQN